MQYKSRTSQLNGLTALAYVGVLPSSPNNFLIKQSAPTTNDYRNVYVGDLWLDNSSQYLSPSVPPTVANLWILVSVTAHVATWVNFGMGQLETLTSNTGGAITPLANNINVVGDATTITGVGVLGTHTITFSTVGTGVVSSLTGNSGGAVFPTAGNINVVGTGVITVVGNPGTSTLTITPSGIIASSFPTDLGTATPSSGVLNIFGGTTGRDINTSGSGNAVHVDLNNTIILGDLTPVAKGSDSLTLTSGDISLNARDAGSAAARGIAKIKFYPAADGQPTNDIYFYLNSIFIGQLAGNQTATPSVALFNVGIGSQSLSSLTTGTHNNAIGDSSLTSCTTGSSNNIMGSSGGSAITTGSQNFALGDNAFYAGAPGVGLLTGSYNIGIGNAAGSSYTGAESSNILLNNSGTVGESNALRIGSSSGTGNQQLNKAFIHGIRGITTGVNDAIAVLVDSAGQLGTISSSLRYKENVENMGQDSEVIYNLRPVTFNYKKHSPKDKSIGLIAEEVAVQAPRLVVYDAEGLPETVKYYDLVPMLLNEILKLNDRIKKLERV